jgi:peptidoglycan/xylan/chitin deacetylase (PgdA/CDA1 family)
MLLLFGKKILVRANAPHEKHSTASYSPWLQLTALTADDDGPFFAIQDLAAYTFPQKHISTWGPCFPSSENYPVPIREMPLIPSLYTTHTVAYLAAHEVLHGDPQTHTIALTFDCETGTSSTLKILETLKEEKVKATFFILGKYAYMFPDIVRQIAADEHEIGNHSFYHPSFTSITSISATQEIGYTESAVEWAIGRSIEMRYFRFPYGARNNATRYRAASLGYQSVFWDIDPRGWDPEKTSQDIVNHVKTTAHSGGIIIMHCGSWNDANALKEVIQELRNLGIKPGTVTDVLTEQDKLIPDYP